MFQTYFSKPTKYDKESILTKYGFNIVEDLESCKVNPYHTLADVARKYGVSRERIRQIYKKIYDEPYTKKYKECKEKIQNQEISCERDPRNKVKWYKQNTNSTWWERSLTEERFLEECQKRGLDVIFPYDKRIDCIVNGYYIKVKNCAISTKTSPTQKVLYYRYNIQYTSVKLVDFFALWHEKTNSFFIVPNLFRARDNGVMIYISDDKSNYYTAKNRWWDYKNGFHQLEFWKLISNTFFFPHTNQNP